MDWSEGKKLNKAFLHFLPYLMIFQSGAHWRLVQLALKPLFWLILWILPKNLISVTRSVTTSSQPASLSRLDKFEWGLWRPSDYMLLVLAVLAFDPSSSFLFGLYLGPCPSGLGRHYIAGHVHYTSIHQQLVATRGLHKGHWRLEWSLCHFCFWGLARICPCQLCFKVKYLYQF